MAEIKTPDWIEICKILDQKEFFNHEDEKSKIQTLFSQYCQEEQSM